MSEVDSTAPAPRRDLSLLSLLVGVASFAWGVAIFVPDVLSEGPAWPAASLGVLAVMLAQLPGRPLIRGLGTFLGVLGFLAGLLQLLALWGLISLLD